MLSREDIVMNISVEDLFPESFQRIKEEEEANRPDPNGTVANSRW